MELMVVCAIFSSITLITFLVYGDARTIMKRSSSRMTSEQTIRTAMQRMLPMLSSVYTPSFLPNVGHFYETPQLPFPAGTTANTFTAGAPGTDSIIFYAPGDLIDVSSVLYPVQDNNTTTGSGETWNPKAGPKLYEIRLDYTYQNDPYAAYQPDQTATSGPAPLILRPLVLREMLIPSHPVTGQIQYLVPPTGSSGNPTGSNSPAASTPTRVLARGLSDCRFYMPSGGQLSVNIYAQDREQNANTARAATIHTSNLQTTLNLLTP